ncbi:DUF6571 family protein [Streptomyces sp. TS71-3]|uniref:DUF6571 family protein n=1 Tax=Streptomyces sp. TS71-3 TaxID=2733862 RepID=UPI001B12F9AE|nr:DUF6571 family protein [Streptomyces sp. TS71-3]GHJ35988.1 hypothetical protein Sm713_15970 [Streptomyces sp. TS71-3]
MTLTYEDLLEADLGKLATAVSDWKNTVDGLKKAASDARKGMKAKSDSARWAGVNATVTKEFIAKTAKEIDDLHAEANSIYQILDDGHRELASLQKQIKQAVEVDAAHDGLRVEDIGNGKVRCYFPHIRGDSDERTQKELHARQHLESRINQLIAHASEIDATMARALRKSHGDDPHNAGRSTYDSLNDAEAERAAELARKGDKMSDAELRELNQLLQFNSKEKDGEFATDFYKGLGGPEKALEFYAQMSIDGTDPDATKTRLNEVRDLQKLMGLNLANATDPDHRHHLPASWGADFRRLGTQEIGWGKGQMSKPYGYQVLGGILRYGNYDARFLDPIAEHISQLHKENPTFFTANRAMGSPDLYGFNPSGRLGSGNDPLNSVLEAMGHSPEAAERFFTQPPTAYNEDGTVKHGGQLGFKSYLDLFTEDDFQWTVDTNDTNIEGDADKKEKALGYGPEALGHALEAATTGQPYDIDHGSAAIKHTEARAHLVNDIVEKFGEHPELIRHNENGDLDSVESGPLYAMRDSLGDITAEYMGDFQRAMYEEDNSSEFPTFGAAANLDGGHAARFLGEVGQDPHAYSAITHAQQAYTARVVDHVINGHSDSTASLDGRVGAAVAPGSAIAGIMSDSRADAIYEYHTASDKEFNEAAGEKQKWVNRILGMGFGKVGEVPIVGAPVEWASEDIQETVMKSIEQDTATKAEQEAGDQYSDGRRAATDSAQSAVDRALARNHHINSDTAQDLRQSARTAAGLSHSDGAQWSSESDRN